MIRDRRTSDRKAKETSTESSNVRALAFGRNYFYPLTNALKSSDNGRALSNQEGLNNAPPWNDSLPIAASCSVQSTIIVSQSGKVYQAGMLHGVAYPTWTHIEIPIPLRCVQVAAGRHFCLARMEGGKAVLAWGAGHFGQLGVVATLDGNANNDDSCSDCSNDSNEGRKKSKDTTNKIPTVKCITLATQPIVIDRLLPAFTGSPIQSIAAGDWHGLALTESGQVWAWGSNRSQQCGIQFSSTNKDRPASSSGTIALPLPIPGLPPMKQIAAGRSHSCALTAGSGKAYCWGSSTAGQCGTGITSRRSIKGTPPSPVQGLPSSLEMVQIDASGNHCVSLSKAGRVFTWGDGREGQLGISIATSTSKCISLQDHQSNKPRLVADLDFVAVAASHEFYKQNSSTVVPGSSTVPVDNLTESKSSAATAEGLALVPRIVSVYASDNSTAAISSSGHIYCWGSNDVGQLGIKTPENVPREVASEILLSENHSSSIRPQHTQLINFRGRDAHVETFDSNHNVLLPMRVKSADALFVELLAFGPNHMLCFGTDRDQDDALSIVGKTLYEAQSDQLQSQQVVPMSLPTSYYIEALADEGTQRPETQLDSHGANNNMNVSDHEKNANCECRDSQDVSQLVGATATSLITTTETATTLGESIQERRLVETYKKGTENDEIDETRKSHNETKRPNIMKRFSNRLLRRRRSQNEKSVR
jgi:alpha-tubulin suppressor-like RCC1 family protein